MPVKGQNCLVTVPKEWWVLEGMELPGEPATQLLGAPPKGMETFVRHRNLYSMLTATVVSPDEDLSVTLMSSNI